MQMSVLTSLFLQKQVKLQKFYDSGYKPDFCALSNKKTDMQNTFFYTAI